MLCSFVLLLFVERGALDERVEINLMRVEVGAVNARKLCLAADDDTAAAAHTGTVDHDRIEGNDGFDAVGAGDLGEELHHDVRADSYDAVKLRLTLFDVSIDLLLEILGGEALFAVGAVVGAHDELVGSSLELVLQDDDVGASEACDKCDVDTFFVHFLCDGVCDSTADAAADDADLLQAIHLGSFTEGAHKVGDIIAFLDSVQHLGGAAGGLDHDGHGAFFTVIARDGNRGAFALLIQTEYDELTCLGVLCDQRSFDLEQANALCIVQKSFLYDFKHLVTSYHYKYFVQAMIVTDFILIQLRMIVNIRNLCKIQKMLIMQCFFENPDFILTNKCAKKCSVMAKNNVQVERESLLRYNFWRTERTVTEMAVKKRPFGGSEMYVITNKSGAHVNILSLGAAVQSIVVPDKNSELRDVVLGYDTPEEYIRNDGYFGAFVGRYANRISGASFTLDGKKYSLTANEGKNTLHGGVGLSGREFSLAEESENYVTLALSDPDGSDGFPGKLNVEVRYEFTDDYELIISYFAETDADTPVSLTNHSYFNLAGVGDILTHELMINADAYLPVDSELIPTGELRSVAGTEFDFRTRRAVKNGFYDHCFLLSSALCAELYSPESGIKMTVLTDMPAVQLYAGGAIGLRRGKGGAKYGKNAALCLETQFFPDSPNRPEFPSTILHPGEIFRSRTIYKFSI